jgi:hypothetical protein
MLEDLKGLFNPNRMLEPIQESLNNSAQNWLLGHPFLNWLVEHPFASLLLLLLLWFLLGGLLRAISNLSERIWLGLLQSPLNLSRVILAKFRPDHLLNLGLFYPAFSTTEKQKRLSYIVKRLEELKQEQDELWQEMTKILEIKIK